MQKPALKDYALLHFTIFLFGFTAIIGKLITVPSIMLVLYRSALATIGMIGVLYLWRKPIKLSLAQAAPLLLTGSLVALHWILFFGSARVSTVSISLAGFSTQALLTSIIEPIFLKRKVKPTEVILGLVSMAGIYLILRYEFNYFLGFAIGMASAVLSALFAVINSKLVQRYDAPVITLYEMIGACVSAIVFLPLWSWFFNEPLQFDIPTNDWIYLVVLAWGFTVFPFSMMTQLLKKLSAFNVNLSLNLEPVYGIFLAFLVFGEKERMSTGFYIGTSVLLLCVLAYPFLNKKGSH